MATTTEKHVCPECGGRGKAPHSHLADGTVIRFDSCGKCGSRGWIPAPRPRQTRREIIHAFSETMCSMKAPKIGLHGFFG